MKDLQGLCINNEDILIVTTAEQPAFPCHSEWAMVVLPANESKIKLNVFIEWRAILLKTWTFSIKNSKISIRTKPFLEIKINKYYKNYINNVKKKDECQ